MIFNATSNDVDYVAFTGELTWQDVRTFSCLNLLRLRIINLEAVSGGLVFPALCMYSMLRVCKEVPLFVVGGSCNSSGLIVLAAAKEIWLRRGSSFLVHPVDELNPPKKIALKETISSIYGSSLLNYLGDKDDNPDRPSAVTAFNEDRTVVYRASDFDHPQVKMTQLPFSGMSCPVRPLR